MRIIAGPTVQLGLDLQYPALRPDTGRTPARSSVFTGDTPGIPAPPLLTCCPPSPCTRLSRASDYYGDSAPTCCHQPATGLPASRLAAGGTGGTRTVPTFTTHSINELGAQLYPGSIAMPTPQAFSMASPPASRPASESRHPPPAACTASRPISARFEPVGDLRGVRHWFLSYAFSLACRARTVWQYRPVLSLSGLLPPSRAPPRSGCPQLSPACCDKPGAGPFTPPGILALRGAP